VKRIITRALRFGCVHVKTPELAPICAPAGALSSEKVSVDGRSTSVAVALIVNSTPSATSGFHGAQDRCIVYRRDRDSDSCQVAVKLPVIDLNEKLSDPW